MQSKSIDFYSLINITVNNIYLKLTIKTKKFGHYIHKIFIIMIIECIPYILPINLKNYISKTLFYLRIKNLIKYYFIKFIII